MKYNNLDDIFYLEDLFIVWQAEQAKEKEYKNDKVDIRSFSRDGFVDEKMWVSSFLNEKRVLYIAREANATGQRLVDDGSFYLKDEESSRKKRIFQRIIAIQNIIKESKEDHDLLSAVGQMSLCFTEVIVLAILSIISKFIGENIFYLIFILSSISTIAINLEITKETQD